MRPAPTGCCGNGIGYDVVGIIGCVARAISDAIPSDAPSWPGKGAAGGGEACREARGAYVYMSLRRKARTARRTRTKAASVRLAKFVQSMPSSMAEPW